MEGMGGEEARDEGRGEEMGEREEGSEGGKFCVIFGDSWLIIFVISVDAF